MTLPFFRWKKHSPAYTSLHKVETSIFLFISEVVTPEQVTRKKLGSIPPTLPSSSLGCTFALQSAVFLLIRGVIPVKL